MLKEKDVILQMKGSLVINVIGFSILSIIITPWLMLAPLMKVFAYADMVRMIKNKAH